MDNMFIICNIYDMTIVVRDKYGDNNDDCLFLQIHSFSNDIHSNNGYVDFINNSDSSHSNNIFGKDPYIMYQLKIEITKIIVHVLLINLFFHCLELYCYYYSLIF